VEESKIAGKKKVFLHQNDEVIKFILQAAANVGKMKE